MNWLLYIGGGIWVTLVTLILIVQCIKDGKTDDIGVQILVTILTLATMANWIWFCWRYIK